MKHVNVAIIGGGLSGTYLAYLLNKQAVDFQLFEAKPILGGRILSVASQDSVLRFDLGPTWFWSHQHRMKTLLDALNINFFEQYAVGDVLYQLYSAEPVQRHKGADALTSFRIRGGMQTLIEGLAENLPSDSISVSSIVKSVKKVGDNWLITFIQHDNEITITASHIIFALPPRVLANTIEVTPSLPNNLVEMLRQTPTWMAAQAKCVVVYQTPFWRAQGFSGEVFSRVGPIAEIHDASTITGDPNKNTYALFGFLGLPLNIRKTLSAEKIKQYCVNQLVNIFGEQAKKTQEVFLKDWSQDDFTCTEYDRNEAPMHPSCDLSAHEQWLAKMAMGFSVTECAKIEAGYLEGALAAAEAAAAKLIRGSLSAKF